MESKMPSGLRTITLAMSVVEEAVLVSIGMSMGWGRCKCNKGKLIFRSGLYSLCSYVNRLSADRRAMDSKEGK